jgi:hypothetical protein
LGSLLRAIQEFVEITAADSAKRRFYPYPPWPHFRDWYLIDADILRSMEADSLHETRHGCSGGLSTLELSRIKEKLDLTSFCLKKPGLIFKAAISSRNRLCRSLDFNKPAMASITDLKSPAL